MDKLYNKGIDASMFTADAWEKILNVSKTGIWSWDFKASALSFSEGWARIAGYESGELKRDAETRTKLIHPDDLDRVRNALDRHVAERDEGYEVEYRILRKDGGHLWVQDRGAVMEWDSDGSPLRLVGVTQDVDRFKRAEERFRAESELRLFVNNLFGLGTWDWDLTNNYIRFSDDYSEISGYTLEELQGPIQNLTHLFHPDDLPWIMAELQQYIAKPEGHLVQRYRGCRKDGAYIWLLSSSSVVEWDEDGKPARLKGGVLNVNESVTLEMRLQKAIEENEQYNERLKTEVAKAVEGLELSRRQNQAMFESNPYINFIFDDQFRAVDCNPAAMDYFGFKTKEEMTAGVAYLLKSGIPDFQPDGRASVGFEARLMRTVEKGYCEFETEMLIYDKRTPFQVVLKRIPYSSSFAIVVYMIDLHSLREARNELMRQDRLLRSINDVATQLISSEPEDFESTIWHSMEQIARNVEVDRMYIWENFEQDGELYCRQIHEWSEGAEPQQGKDFTVSSPYSEMTLWWNTLSVGKSINTIVSALGGFEREVLESQGIISLLVIPIFLRGNFWGFIGFDDCQTERVFTEIDEKILQSGGILMVSGILRNNMTESLIEAREQALASTRAKTDFLSRMSHEIRTPMNAIIGMTTIAHKAADVDKIKHCLDKIDNASRQLLGIINDILDMSKIEANKFEISTNEFDFEKMMQNVFNVMQVKIEEKHQEFSFDIQDMFVRNVVSDELRLSQVLINLLSNAVKFTPDMGNISLKVRHWPHENSDGGQDQSILRVEVQDSGIGISDEQKNRLFKSFEQADGGITRRFGGTGLGLAICKKIVNLMGGDIWVESQPDRGSCFIFEIVIEWGEPCRAALTPSGLRNDMRILVVDDTEDVLDYFTNILGSFSLRCDVASSGLQAVGMVKDSLKRKMPYDLIFMDWNMPVMSGGEAARQIKQISEETIVVMISVVDWADIEQEVAGIGVTQFLTKPVLPSVLYNTVVQLTERTFVTESATRSEQSYNWGDKCVLLVEDIEINREIIISILEDTGIVLECAENGVAAVDMFAKHGGRYDMILMDVQMPVLDGLGATKKIRAMDNRWAKEIPIVAMTANAFKEDVHDCLEAGMNNHIAKPIDVDELVEKLSHYLSKPRVIS